MSHALAQIDGQPERRRADRSALRLSATMRESGRSRTSVRLIDISTHGCRIETTSSVSPETWVWLSIAGLETQYCRIVWKHEEFAGLEFATPLSEPVLDKLLSDCQRLSETAIGELRDIANRTHRLASLKKGDDAQMMAELSRKCAVEAVVEGFRISEDGTGPAPRP